MIYYRNIFETEDKLSEKQKEILQNITSLLGDKSYTVSIVRKNVCDGFYLKIGVDVKEKDIREDSSLLQED